MNLKSTLYTLLFLTGLTAVLATFFSEIDTIGILIVLLSSVKFLLVAFYFMELKKANVFWKTLIVSYLVVFTIIISVVLF